MSLRILIVPDKFKGTLSAPAAAETIARGWKRSRPQDHFTFLPMSDGGDGFGEVISTLLKAKPQKIETVDAAHRSLNTNWWWAAESKTAIIESAKVIGLAMLPAKKFHPFQLDTFGLGRVLKAAAKKGVTNCLIGIGGSATNDGGFGLARGLGWKFLDQSGKEIVEWWQLQNLSRLQAPPKTAFKKMKITVAVDVENPLLGAKGCSRIYGPQKGLRPEDFLVAERGLKKLSQVSKKQSGHDYAVIPGAGAAGGLGFGLMAFARAKPESGFTIFSEQSRLEAHLQKADLVITGEGAIDQQTLMGKGVGQVALLCKKYKVPSIGLAGLVFDPGKAKKLFTVVRGLTEITSVDCAKERPAEFLEKLSLEVSQDAEAFIQITSRSARSR